MKISAERVRTKVRNAAIISGIRHQASGIRLSLSPKFRKTLRFFLSVTQAILDLLIYNLCFTIIPITLTFEVRSFLTGTMSAFFLFGSLYGFRNWTFWEETKAVLRSGLMILLVSALFIYTSKVNLPFVLMIASLGTFLAVDLTLRYFFRRVLFTVGVLNK